MRQFLLSFLFLSSCTTATVKTGDTEISFTRFWSDAAVSSAPDGSFSYSSSPNQAAVDKLITALIAALQVAH